jgi:uncharacterized protein with ATP-grasp and redox domains
MIFLSPECFPCFLLQADLAARAHGATDEERVSVAVRSCRLLTDLPSSENVPAQTATRLHAEVRATLGTDDPFLPVKERHLSRFAETAKWAQGVAAAARDPWAAAVWLSVAGNIMDSGIIEQEAMERQLGPGAPQAEEFRLPGEFRRRLLEARTVGVLLDNAGEAAFDVPLLSLLASDGRRVWLGVKGGPVIDDLTMADAQRLGLSAYGELVSNGNCGVGTDLSQCAETFLDRLEGSDLILSKGQANFETLVGRYPRAYFLLRCKCPVVSRAVGKPEGDLLVLCADGRPAA